MDGRTKHDHLEVLEGRRLKAKDKLESAIVNFENLMRDLAQEFELANDEFESAYGEKPCAHCGSVPALSRSVKAVDDAHADWHDAQEAVTASASDLASTAHDLIIQRRRLFKVQKDIAMIREHQL